MTSWHLLGARHGLCVIIQTIRLNYLLAPPCFQAWVVYAWWIIIVQAVKTVKLSSQSSCQDRIGWIGECRSDSLTVLTAWGGGGLWLVNHCANIILWGGVYAWWIIVLTPLWVLGCCDVVMLGVGGNLRQSSPGVWFLNTLALVFDSSHFAGSQHPSPDVWSLMSSLVFDRPTPCALALVFNTVSTLCSALCC